MHKKHLICSSILLLILTFTNAQTATNNDANSFLKKKNAGLAYNKGIANIKAKNYKEASANFSEAIDNNPSFDIAYLSRSKVKFELSDTAGALADIKKALEINTSLGEGYFCLGYLYLITDTAKATVDLFDKAIQNGYAEPFVYYYRGILKDYKKDAQGALNDISIAIERKPEYSIAYFDRGCVRMQLNDYQGAIYDFRQSLFYDSTMIAAYNNMANAKTHIGNYQDAINDLNKLIEKQPDNYMALNTRGCAKYLNSAYQESSDDFKSSISLNEKYTAAYNNLGNSLSKLAENKSAIEQYDKALKINPNFAEVYLNRGIIKELTGDVNGACNDWAMAEKLGNPDAAKYVKECK